MKNIKKMITENREMYARLPHERKVLSDSDIETTTGTEKDTETPYAFPCGVCHRKYKTLRGITRHRLDVGHYPTVSDRMNW